MILQGKSVQCFKLGKNIGTLRFIEEDTLKKIVCLMAFFVIFVGGVAASHAADYAVGKAPTAFRGLPWGATLEQAPGLLPVKESGFKNTYFKTDEPLKFGEADITSVAYYFRKNRFYRVGIAFEGRVNHFLLKEQLISRYGRGRGVGKRYGWMWSDFSIEIDFDDDTKTGGLYYTFEGKLD